MDTPPEEHVYHLADEHPKAIVVHCCDNRFQSAFREFITNELHLAEGEYIPMILSGGVASLSEPFRLPKEFKYVTERVGFFLERFTTVRRIVLINHEDCRHYEALKSAIGSVFLHHVSHMTERQTKDLEAAAKSLLALGAPGIQVDLYYARIVKNGAATVKFEKI